MPTNQQAEGVAFRLFFCIRKPRDSRVVPFGYRVVPENEIPTATRGIIVKAKIVANNPPLVICKKMVYTYNRIFIGCAVGGC